MQLSSAMQRLSQRTKRPNSYYRFRHPRKITQGQSCWCWYLGVFPIPKRPLLWSALMKPPRPYFIERLAPIWHAPTLCDLSLSGLESDNHLRTKKYVLQYSFISKKRYAVKHSRDFPLWNPISEDMRNSGDTLPPPQYNLKGYIQCLGG